MTRDDSLSSGRLRIAPSDPGLARKLFLLLWVSYGVLSFLFGFTDGLALDCGGDIGPVGKICHTNQFMDSAANDDIVILVGIAFGAVGAAWGFVRLKLTLRVTDLIVYALLLGLQALFMALTDQGSVSYTIMADRNAVLLLWVLSYLMLWVMFIGGAIAMLRHPRQPVRSEHYPEHDN